MHNRARVVALLAPSLVVMTVLFAGGLAAGLARSLNYSPMIGLTQPSLDAYASVLQSAAFRSSLAFSLYIATVSTLLSAALALVVAIAMRGLATGRTVLGFLFQMNLALPHVIGAIGMMYLLSQSGSFARVAAMTGMIADPQQFPELIYDRAAIGIISEYVWKEVPFICLILLANMQSLGEDREAAARVLGATRWQAVRHVLLPQLLPGLLAASAIVFAFTFGAYEVPLLLGPRFPEALPVLAYRMYTDVDIASRPEALATAMIIAAISAATIVAFAKSARIVLGR